MDIYNTREYEAAQELKKALNDYSWSPQKFADGIGTFHKILQQTLMRTIVTVIKNMGPDNYRVDSRNKASHELCRKIVNSGILDEITLPMIIVLWNQDTSFSWTSPQES